MRFFIFILAALMFWPASSTAGDFSDNDHIPGRNYKVMIGDQLLTVTSRQPYQDDEIFFPDGRHYRIKDHKGTIYQAVSMGKDKTLLGLNEYFANLEAVPVATQEPSGRPIAIYHTHTDESYLPSDGKASIPYHGGIYQVGEKFNQKLEANNVNTKLDKTPHDPHDANAYMRSRRTAVKLLKENPAAMFDIHRDGVDDPNVYREDIKGIKISQLQLIVGRQNPKMHANLDFAKRLLSYSNKKYPGLVKSIYLAHGNYNQDLLPTALLIEAGTYTNYKSTAEDGIALFAGIVPEMMGLMNQPGQPAHPPESNRAPLKTTAFIIMLVLVAGAAFVAINAGPDELEKLRQRITGRVPIEKVQPYLARAGATLDTGANRIKEKSAHVSRRAFKHWLKQEK
ncbi:stage II sporulation protein P [Desulfotomaculum arcticum]|uniref:Stage II sporulation protein P n=1 Tax=Desulfotruncus arcticus DSM 17038 TaxID=1121424 RepID=A0A1I2Q810_9FIRM|nr:stage II sporulation protein P [Desulfotruncus arcticus]SFG24625.1 stage II sporulation protein P [Desulfotomaculum arcticum] [Desulfotruncus arcticus DSM 17038]